MNCPDFVLTATSADPAQIAGFNLYLGGAMSAQSGLMDVAVYAGATQDGAGAPGKAEGARKLSWRFDGQSPVKVACLYEGGVTLLKAVGSPKACTAAIKRSKEKDAGGWGHGDRRLLVPVTFRRPPSQLSVSRRYPRSRRCAPSLSPPR